MSTVFARWRTSSRSKKHNCVEVHHARDGVGIRDTKNRDGGTLVLGAAAFRAFITTVKNERVS